jgi:hypothetical protein
MGSSWRLGHVSNFGIPGRERPLAAHALLVTFAIMLEIPVGNILQHCQALFLRLDSGFLQSPRFILRPPCNPPRRERDQDAQPNDPHYNRKWGGVSGRVLLAEDLRTDCPPNLAIAVHEPNGEC